MSRSGTYRVRVGGTGATAYRLLVTRAAGIAFEMPELPVRIELLDAAGEVVSEAEPLNDILFVDTRGLQAGIGVLRISRGDVAGSSAKALRVAPPLH